MSLPGIPYSHVRQIRERQQCRAAEGNGAHFGTDRSARAGPLCPVRPTITAGMGEERGNGVEREHSTSFSFSGHSFSRGSFPRDTSDGQLKQVVAEEGEPPTCSRCMVAWCLNQRFQRHCRWAGRQAGMEGGGWTLTQETTALYRAYATAGHQLKRRLKRGQIRHGRPLTPPGGIRYLVFSKSAHV